MNIENSRIYVDCSATVVGLMPFAKGVHEKYETELFEKMARNGIVVE